MSYWKIAPGHGGILWVEQRENECIAVGSTSDRILPMKTLLALNHHIVNMCSHRTE